MPLTENNRQQRAMNNPAISETTELSRDQAPPVAAGTVADLEKLVSLARDKSEDSRAALVTSIGDLYSGASLALTKNDRQIMAEIIRKLLHDVEASVRSALAERFSDTPDAPHELVVMLAHDEIDVACPLLIKSSVLRDKELVEIIEQRTMEHQLAVAMRPMISETVSDALVATDNEKVITTLLSNEGAQIAVDTMAHLVEQSRGINSYQVPLASRPDLSPGLARKLCWWVSAALRKQILKDFEIDPDELDDTIEGAVEDVTLRSTTSLEQQLEQRKALAASQTNPGPTLMMLLERGEVPNFLDTFVKVSGLPLTIIRKMVFEPGGEGLAITCKAVGIDKADFGKIFLVCRQGRLGDKEVDPGELKRAISFYDETPLTAAESLVRQWKRDPEYLDALKHVDRISEL